MGGLTAMGHEGVFRDAGNSLRPDLGDGYAGVYILQNSDLYIFLCVKYTSIQNNFSLQGKKSCRNMIYSLKIVKSLFHSLLPFIQKHSVD